MKYVKISRSHFDNFVYGIESYHQDKDYLCCKLSGGCTLSLNGISPVNSFIEEFQYPSEHIVRLSDNQFNKSDSPWLELLDSSGGVICRF